MVKKKSVKKAVSSSSVPEGIKILSVLYFAGAFVSLFFAAFAFNFADIIGQNIQSALLSPEEIVPPYVFLVAAFLLLAVAALNYFVARGLWTSKNWSRILVVVFSVIGALGSLYNMFTGMLWSGIYALVFNGLIVWYLFFRKDIVKRFK